MSPGETFKMPSCAVTPEMVEVGRPMILRKTPLFVPVSVKVMVCKSPCVTSTTVTLMVCCELDAVLPTALVIVTYTFAPAE